MTDYISFFLKITSPKKQLPYFMYEKRTCGKTDRLEEVRSWEAFDFKEMLGNYDYISRT